MRPAQRRRLELGPAQRRRMAQRLGRKRGQAPPAVLRPEGREEEWELPLQKEAAVSGDDSPFDDDVQDESRESGLEPRPPCVAQPGTGGLRWARPSMEFFVLDGKPRGVLRFDAGRLPSFVDADGAAAGFLTKLARLRDLLVRRYASFFLETAAGLCPALVPVLSQKDIDTSNDDEAGDAEGLGRGRKAASYWSRLIGARTVILPDGSVAPLRAFFRPELGRPSESAERLRVLAEGIDSRWTPEQMAKRYVALGRLAAAKLPELARWFSRARFVRGMDKAGGLSFEEMAKSYLAEWDSARREGVNMGSAAEYRKAVWRLKGWFTREARKVLTTK